MLQLSYRSCHSYEPHAKQYVWCMMRSMKRYVVPGAATEKNRPNPFDSSVNKQHEYRSKWLHDQCDLLLHARNLWHVDSEKRLSVKHVYSTTYAESEMHQSMICCMVCIAHTAYHAYHVRLDLNFACQTLVVI